MEENQDRSDWNEQQLFAMKYFNQGDTCRQAQLMNDWELLSIAVRGKVNLALGILPSKDQERLFKSLGELDRVIRNYKAFGLKTNPIIQNPNAEIMIDSLMHKLLVFEAEIDTIVNKYMPFLNVKRDYDLKRL